MTMERSSRPVAMAAKHAVCRTIALRKRAGMIGGSVAATGFLTGRAAQRRRILVRPYASIRSLAS